MPTIKYKKLVHDLPDLEIHTDGAVGVDLYCAKDMTVNPGEVAIVPLGVAFECPEGYMGILATRSSLPRKKGVFIPNGVGIMDTDYRGEYMIQLVSLKDPVDFKKGERIAQVVFTPVMHKVSDPVVVTPVDVLSETVRGAGGFGSTGH